MYQPLIKFHPHPAIITQVLCIFVLLATHGIVKKEWKVPTKEIAKAEEIRKIYFKSK